MGLTSAGYHIAFFFVIVSVFAGLINAGLMQYLAAGTSGIDLSAPAYGEMFQSLTENITATEQETGLLGQLGLLSRVILFMQNFLYATLAFPAWLASLGIPAEICTVVGAVQYGSYCFVIVHVLSGGRIRDE